MSIGKLKTNVNHLGTSFNSSFNSAVHKIHKKAYDSEDELIFQYQHDIKRVIMALKYISSQIHLFANKAIPKMFKFHMKSVELFSKLIGANSLHFKELDQYYQEFDRLQAQSEIPLVHPKELQFEVPSLNEQLYNYMVSIDTLAAKLLDDWDFFEKSNKIRIEEMQRYLYDTLKLINKRNKKQRVYEKNHKKLEKLMKKTTPLDDKEAKSMNSLEKDLQQNKYIFEKLDEKVRTILPHIFSFLEEFIDTISKMILCKQVDTYKAIHESLRYFVTYYGLMSEKEQDDPSYQLIMDAWENSMTPVRLQLETFISIIKNKDPEIIDREIDDEDKTLKAGKMWNKLNRKMVDHKFSLNPTDQRNGLFNGYLIADHLDAFLEYHNPSFTASETYYPKTGPKDVDVSVPEIKVSKENKNPPGPPPPLPPREMNPRSLTMATSPHLGFPSISLPNSPKISTVPTTPVSGYGFDKKHSYSTSDDSLDSESESVMSDTDNFSDKDDDNDDDDEWKSLLSSSNSISTSQLFDDTNKGKNSKLTRIYNSRKSQMNEAPMVITKDSKQTDIPRNDDAFNNASTITHKLDEFNKFFNKVLKLTDASDHKVLTAKYDFEGQEPGDLSFKVGDKIEIIFNFHNSSATNPDDAWLIGIAHCSDDNPVLNRIGLVPGNYF